MLCTTGIGFKRNWKTCDNSSRKSGKGKTTSSRGTEPSTPQTEERVEVEERDPVHPLPAPERNIPHHTQYVVHG
jgi:hypothetical protein